MRKLIGTFPGTKEQCIELMHKHRGHCHLHYAKMGDHPRYLIVGFPVADHSRETLEAEGVVFLPVVEDPSPIGSEHVRHWPDHHGLHENDTAFRAMQKIFHATGKHPGLNTTVY